MRPALCEDALRLGRVLAELAPGEPEVHGLVALMEIQASRARARVDATGAPVRLLEQDRGRWDQLLIRRGLVALDRAATLGLTPGPYVLQAEIAACHARARTAEATDWARIADVYSQLARATPSPIVERIARLPWPWRPVRRPAPCHGRHPRLEPALKEYHSSCPACAAISLTGGRSRRSAQGIERRSPHAKRPRARPAVRAGAEERTPGVVLRKT
jgi:hypothetical protein